MFVETKEPSALPTTKVGPIEEGLVKARALIEQGWIKGSAMRPKIDGAGHNYCALGALATVLGVIGFSARSRPDAMDAYHAAELFLERELPTAGGTVVMFNDRVGTTHADILGLYDRAIAKAKEGNA